MPPVLGVAGAAAAPKPVGAPKLNAADAPVDAAVLALTAPKPPDPKAGALEAGAAAAGAGAAAAPNPPDPNAGVLDEPNEEAGVDAAPNAEAVDAPKLNAAEGAAGKETKTNTPTSEIYQPPGR